MMPSISAKHDDDDNDDIDVIKHVKRTRKIYLNERQGNTSEVKWVDALREKALGPTTELVSETCGSVVDEEITHLHWREKWTA